MSCFADLQKENTELKETLGKCAKMPVLYCLGAKETIIKAKKLLKILLEDYISEPEVFSDGSCEDNELHNLIKEIEQFLKDSEGK